MKKSVAQVVVGLPVEGPFDYRIHSGLRPPLSVGKRVRVTFNRRQRLGVVVRLKERSSFKNLNPVLSCLDNESLLTKNDLALTKAVSAYYGCSWGEALEIWLPAALRRAKPSEIHLPDDAPGIRLPKAQTVLLHDQSREKRWPVIIARMQEVLKQDGRIIFLVPEFSLIDSVVARLKEHISVPVGVLDKKVSPDEELAQWLRVREGTVPIVIGTRSAVFAPVSRLGLIVIYDEENSAYKQEQTPHYHAHTVASMRSKIENCSVLYVSSAPSAQTWAAAKKGKWPVVSLPTENLSAVQVVDMTNYNPRRTSILSFPLQNAIRETLEKGGKVLLFMNRKGFSTRTRCNQCGFTVKCPRCDVNLTYLYSKKEMVCRHCNLREPLPKVCPQCQSSYLRSTGTGIEKLESEIARLYPQARVGHYERESAEPRAVDIMIATQAILRRQGDLRPALVGVVHFDAELHHMDFRAGERAFSILVYLRQLAGEKLLVQTRHPDNYCLKAARAWDFEKFYRQELKLRKELEFPPYRHFVAIGLRGVKEDVVFEQANELCALLEAEKSAKVEISEPYPDVTPKLRDKYRFTIMLKAKDVEGILALTQSVLKNFKRKRGTVIAVNVDP